MSGVSRVKYYKNAQIWPLTSCDYPHMEQSLFASNFPGAANGPQAHIGITLVCDRKRGGHAMLRKGRRIGQGKDRGK